MLLLVIIVAFILTIIIIESASIFSSFDVNKEKMENIILEYSGEEDKIEFLKEITGKVFFKNEYEKSERINLKCRSIVFFEDYDIFLDSRYKLEKLIIYPIMEDSVVDIINYAKDIITIYTN